MDTPLFFNPVLDSPAAVSDFFLMKDIQYRGWKEKKPAIQRTAGSFYAWSELTAEEEHELWTWFKTTLELVGCIVFNGISAWKSWTEAEGTSG